MKPKRRVLRYKFNSSSYELEHQKIESEFKVSNYMVRKAKALVKSGGILSTPNPNHGHGLSNETITMVQNYYESDDINQVMPGKKRLYFCQS